MSALKSLSIAALCAVTLSACVVAPARPYAYGPPAGEVVITDVAPPAPYAES